MFLKGVWKRILLHLSEILCRALPQLLPPSLSIVNHFGLAYGKECVTILILK
jgi:hypothetical protein